MRKPRYYCESNFYHIMVQGDEINEVFEELIKNTILVVTIMKVL